jgi:hypothetical protein
MKNTRSIISPLELDFYLPDFNIAIEVNGAYWHSIDAGKDQTYHLRKTQLCKNIGIHLIHIFDYEWKQPFFKYYIQSLLSPATNPNNIKININNDELTIELLGVANIHEDLRLLLPHRPLTYQCNLLYEDSKMWEMLGFKIIDTLPPEIIQHYEMQIWNCGYEIWHKD